MSVVRGDAVRLPLRDGCVDLIVTSPPYFALRSYRDGDEHYDGQIGSEATPVEFLRALWAVLDECWRVLKPTGSCWVNLGDKYAGSGGHNNAGISGGPSQLQGRTQRATDFKTERVFTGGGGAGRRADQRNAARRNAPDRYNQAADVLPKSVMGLPWRFALGAACPDPYRTVYEPGDHPQWVNRRPHVWHKPNGLPESVTDRCRANFEDWFHLTKQGRYFSAVDEIREPTEGSNGVSWDERKANGEGPRQGEQRITFGAGMASNPLGKLPGSVWTIATEPLIIPDAVRAHYRLPDHFAAFPQEWPRRIILGWSPRNGVVLDPFVGTGTTIGVANALGRTGIGVDLSNDYCRLAQWRTQHSNHFAKAASRTDAERQGNLLDFVGPFRGMADVTTDEAIQ